MLSFQVQTRRWTTAHDIDNATGQKEDLSCALD
jgi:hypothetical protein